MIQQVLRPMEVDCLVGGRISTTGTRAMNDDIEGELRQVAKTCPVCQVHRMYSKRFVLEIRSRQLRCSDCTGSPPGGGKGSRQRQTDKSASCDKNRFWHRAESLKSTGQPNGNERIFPRPYVANLSGSAVAFQAYLDREPLELSTLETSHRTVKRSSRPRIGGYPGSCVSSGRSCCARHG